MLRMPKSEINDTLGTMVFTKNTKKIIIIKTKIGSSI